MAKMNPGFLNLKKSYLFIEIGKRVREYIAAHPDNKIIKMGIGDVTQPLAPVVVEAMKKAADEMGVKETFRGYEDSGKGYDFLREAVRRNHFSRRSADKRRCKERLRQHRRHLQRKRGRCRNRPRISRIC